MKCVLIKMNKPYIYPRNEYAAKFLGSQEQEYRHYDTKRDFRVDVAEWLDLDHIPTTDEAVDLLNEREPDWYWRLDKQN